MLIWNDLLCLKASAFAHNRLSEKKGLMIVRQTLAAHHLFPKIFELMYLIGRLKTNQASRFLVLENSE